MRYLEIDITPEMAGKTAGDVLRRYGGLSRKAISGAKQREMGITLDGELVYTIATVEAGQVLRIVIEDKPEALATHSVFPQDAPAEFPLDIVFEDDDLLIINKPAGLVMYPNKGHNHDTLGNYVMGYLQATNQRCVLHPVQRLDKGTSGLVVFTKNAHAQNRLTKALHSEGFERLYLALCEGEPVPAQGSVEVPIMRTGYSPSTFSITNESDKRGKYALTYYETLATVSDVMDKRNAVSLLKLKLATGRTHQIRLHMAHIGHPLLGDKTYGGLSMGDVQLNRPALHSYEIKMTHPLTGSYLELHAPLPKDLEQIMDICGLDLMR